MTRSRTFWTQPDADVPGAWSVCTECPDGPVMIRGGLDAKAAEKMVARFNAANPGEAKCCKERTDLRADNERLRAALKPFAEIARRMGWDRIADDDMALGDHVVDAPADDIAPGAFYCLMVGAFREAARATEQKADKS